MLDAVIYFIYARKREQYTLPAMLEMEPISALELAQLDKEYARWRAIVIGLFVAVIVISLVFFF